MSNYSIDTAVKMVKQIKHESKQAIDRIRYQVIMKITRDPNLISAINHYIKLSSEFNMFATISPRMGIQGPFVYVDIDNINNSESMLDSFVRDTERGFFREVSSDESKTSFVFYDNMKAKEMKKDFKEDYKQELYYFIHYAFEALEYLMKTNPGIYRLHEETIYSFCFDCFSNPHLDVIFDVVGGNSIYVSTNE
jgi:hypothetical protein